MSAWRPARAAVRPLGRSAQGLQVDISDSGFGQGAL